VEDVKLVEPHQPAEHVPFDAEPPYLVNDLPRPPGVSARHLHVDLRPGRLDQHGQPTLPVRDQAERTLQARQGDPSGPGRQQISSGAAHTHATPLLVLNQIGNTDPGWNPVMPASS
jgi:hypothetical protein